MLVQAGFYTNVDVYWKGFMNLALCSVCLCSDQVLDDLLYLGLSLLYLLCRPLQTDALLTVRKLNVNLHTQTKMNQSKSIISRP